MSNESEALRLVNNRHNAHMLTWQGNACAELRRLHEVNRVMLNVLTWIADQTYDPWTNGAEAQRIAAAAIAKVTTP